MPKLNKTQTRMIRLIAEEYAAALNVRDQHGPDKVDAFAAGVADGMRSCASWLGIEREVENQVKVLQMKGGSR